MITAKEVRQYQNNTKKDIDFVELQILKAMKNNNTVGVLLYQSKIENLETLTKELRVNGYIVKLYGNEYFYIGWGGNNNVKYL